MLIRVVDLDLAADGRSSLEKYRPCLYRSGRLRLDVVLFMLTISK